MAMSEEMQCSCKQYLTMIRLTAGISAKSKKVAEILSFEFQFGFQVCLRKWVHPSQAVLLQLITWKWWSSFDPR